MKIKGPFKDSYYVKSKLEAENYLLQYKDKIDVIILHPAFMIGAYDTKPGSGKIILFCLKTRLLFHPPGGKNFVHVKDVSKGILQGMVKGVNGEHYLLCNENFTYSEFFRELSRIAHHPSVRIRIPGPVLIAMGYFGDLLRFFRVKTDISSVNMRMICVSNFYSNSKSVAELDMLYQPVEDAIRDAISYFDKKRSALKH
jgi:nucleoside-diphosphate-sugar epimerase